MSRRHRTTRPMIPAGPAKLSQADQQHALGIALLRDGELLHRQRDVIRAAHLYRKALDYVRPKSRAFYRAMFMSGLAAYQLRFYAEAAFLLDQVALDPIEWKNPDLHYNRGMVASSMGQTEDAITHYQRCLALNPTYGAAEMHLGNLFRDQGDGETAELCYQRVLARNDDDPHAQYNLAFVLLQRGDLAQGFKLYDARWRCDGHVAEYGRPDLTAPRWRVAEGGQHRVLVFADQGLGDAIQFVRYLPWLLEHTAGVILEVHGALADCFAPYANDPRVTLIPRGAPPPPHDRVISLLSLATEHETTLDRIPPVLTPAVPRGPALLSPDLPGLRVGLVWAGSAAHHNDRLRSAALRDLLPTLATVPGVTWVSVQLEARGAELVHALPEVLPALVASGSQVVDASGKLRTFGDTARLFRDELDALVTVDTSVAHLAGTLGLPTWLMLPEPGEWRWLEGRSDTPWYPSVRLVRQQSRGDWQSVAAQIAQDLTRTLTETP
jgi:hypothetical protein